MPWVQSAATTSFDENDEKEIVAIHAALLPTGEAGEILFYGGPGWGSNIASTPCGLYDVANDATREVTSTVPEGNAFCGGHAFLADGRLISVGGQFPGRPDEQNFHTSVIGQNPDGLPEHFAHGGGMQGGGERICWIYEPRGARWVEAAPLNLAPSGHEQSGGRWYPAAVTLPDGRIWTTGGHPDVREVYPPTPGFPGTPPTPAQAFEYRHNTNTPELYSPGADAWTQFTEERTAPNAAVIDSYPRFHLLPSGLLFSVTPGNDAEHPGQRLYDPYAARWEGPSIGSPSGYGMGSDETSVLLPLLPPHNRARVLTTNEAEDYVIDLHDVAEGGDPPAWTAVSPARAGVGGGSRRHACATLLPTGDVLLTGGVRGSGDDFVAINQAMRYRPGIDWSAGDFSDPEDEPWEAVGTPSAIDRGYHSTALLMPDGRVWAAGSTDDDPVVFEHGIDIFDPGYGPNRPSLTGAPPSVAYGMPFEAITPDAGRIARVALIRCGSVTHAFNFDQRYVGCEFERGSDRLAIVAPPNGRVAPPGVYMLWIVDEDGRPCERARFVRLTYQKVEWWLEKSTVSEHEVAALGGAGAYFSEALYLAFDGFLPAEVGAPSVSVHRIGGDPLPGVVLVPEGGSPQHSVGASAVDRAQTIVWRYGLRVDDPGVFDDVIAGSDDLAFVFVEGRAGAHRARANLMLSRNPNPFMRDGNPPWLSIDLRVFAAATGDAPTAGVALGGGSEAPIDYIRDVLDAYNAEPPGDGHPFDALPTDQSTNRLPCYSEQEDGRRVHNFAVAKVRYLAPADVAPVDVRVFFRMWRTGWTGLDYATDRNYRRAGNGASAAPLLGLMDGELTTIPCFASPRVGDMTQQADPPNLRALQGQDAAEVAAYFGAWLDFNQETLRFPLRPLGDGPFDGQELVSVQESMRGLHQCLVAEIHLPEDPILPGSTPSSNDNLAQRNILLDDCDNPGPLATHLVNATLALKPSATALPTPVPGAPPFLGRDATGRSEMTDLLFLDWGGLPRDSLVFLHIPSVDAAAIVEVWAARGLPSGLAVADPGTLRLEVSEISTLPLPAGDGGPIPALLSVQVPPGVSAGERFRIVLKQVQGRSRRVRGATGFDIVVREPGAITPHLRRNVSVLRHIHGRIPAADRWRPIFDRWLGELDDRLRGFGIDPADVPAAPTGGGTRPDRPCDDDRPRPDDDRHRVCGRIRTLWFDCFGGLEGFELDCGDGHAVRFECCEPGLADLLLRLRRERTKVCVHHHPQTTREPMRIEVIC